MLLLALAACANPAPPSAAKPAPSPAQAPLAVASAPAADTPASDAERVRAGQLVQRLYATTHGPVSVQSIALESGVFHMKVVTRAAPKEPLDVYLTRDLRTLFPSGIDTARRVQEAAADRDYDDCLKAKGLRLYGDPRQAQTQRQLAELGVYGRALLVDCAANPGDCRLLKETPLPMLMFGTKQITSFVPRQVIATWTGCDQAPVVR